MSYRRGLLLFGILALCSAAAVAMYFLGEQGCPPPGWAFWRFTEGTGGRTNFACIASR